MTVKLIDNNLTLDLLHKLQSWPVLLAYFDKAYKNGWKMYVVDQRRGWCRHNTKTITIPKWCMVDKREGYLQYYVAHELSHIGNPGHGENFMEQLKRLCPPEYWHYELNYKPRNAAAAGIVAPK